MSAVGRPKISFGIIVLNGEPFIKYQLESLYPHAHEILIVEGAVKKFWHCATPDGRSTDRTVEIIKNFPDPEYKIKLIQREGFWPEKDEMSNAYMEACTGDYIWQVDVDEFYKAEDIEKIIQYVSDNPDITQVNIKAVNFWRGFKAVMQGVTYVFGTDQFNRIFRFKPGYRYLTHRPPTVIDENGGVIDGRTAHAGEIESRLGVYIYHYSYIFPQAVKGKSRYYAGMKFLHEKEDEASWFSNEWSDFSNPLRVHLIAYPPSWIIPFKGEHPEAIKRLVQDIGFREDNKIASYLEGEYRKYQAKGERLLRIIASPRKRKKDRLKDSLKVLSTLSPPFTKRDREADLSILMTAAKVLIRGGR